MTRGILIYPSICLLFDDDDDNGDMVMVVMSRVLLVESLESILLHNENVSMGQWRGVWGFLGDY
jgi:hypothetical protein